MIEYRLGELFEITLNNGMVIGTYCEEDGQQQPDEGDLFVFVCCVLLPVNEVFALPRALRFGKRLSVLGEPLTEKWGSIAHVCGRIWRADYIQVEVEDWEQAHNIFGLRSRLELNALVEMANERHRIAMLNGRKDG